ncbi:MAG: SDR family oxidoreductase [Arhodomonas sp.]|nr:SDR family oxidoreductase [Arhodomonas sp.]
MGFLDGKKALIVGVASNRSIAWGVAEAMAENGAEIALTYQNDKLKARVEQCAEVCGSRIVLPLDVTRDEEIEAVFAELERQWDGLDIVVHAVGFAPREELEGSFVDNTTRGGFDALPRTSAPTASSPWRKAARPMMQGP